MGAPRGNCNAAKNKAICQSKKKYKPPKITEYKFRDKGVSLGAKIFLDRRKRAMDDAREFVKEREYLLNKKQATQRQLDALKKARYMKQQYKRNTLDWAKQHKKRKNL